MSDLTTSNDKDFTMQAGAVVSYLMAAVKIPRGVACFLNGSGYLTSAFSASYTFVGVSLDNTDNSAGSAGDKSCRVQRVGVVPFDSSITSVSTLTKSTDLWTVAVSGNVVTVTTASAHGLVVGNFFSTGSAWTDNAFMASLTGKRILAVPSATSFQFSLPSTADQVATTETNASATIIPMTAGVANLQANVYLTDNHTVSDSPTGALFAGTLVEVIDCQRVLVDITVPATLGTLPVSEGGTGHSSITKGTLWYGSATGVLSEITRPASDGAYKLRCTVSGTGSVWTFAWVADV